jgi:3-oxoacyl-[acyl-carrier-protein] synthase II
MSRIVVTGAGCVTPIGIGRREFETAIRAGSSGLRELSQCDPSPYACRVAGEVLGFDPLEFMDVREARTLPRVVQFAVAASRLAIADANMGSAFAPERVGVIVGTSSGPIAYSFEQQLIFFERGARRMHPSSPAFAHNGAIASECAIQVGVHGPVFAVSSACTSSTDAIGLGASLLREGVVDAMLVGGAEAPLTPSLFAAFDRLKMMPSSFNSAPQEASRPFDIRREGMVLGEGAAILVLETEQVARSRGAIPIMEIAGYGSTCDAASHFHQEGSGDQALRAINLALTGASATVADIDYVNAHGTATRENDVFESRVLRRLFGSLVSSVPVSSVKSQLGHSLGACGCMEVMAVMAGMEGGFVPATTNLQYPDPECALAHVPGVVRDWRIDVALSTNFGFGSRNAALVLRRVSK